MAALRDARRPRCLPLRRHRQVLLPVLDRWTCTAESPDSPLWERPAADTFAGRHGYSRSPQSLIALGSSS